MATTIHPSAIVDNGAELGDGCRVCHFVHVSGGARVGLNCSIGQNVYGGNDVVIGDKVKIQNNVSLYDAVTLESDVFCGPSMVFTNVYSPRSAVSRKEKYRRTPPLAAMPSWVRALWSTVTCPISRWCSACRLGRLAG